MAESLPSFSVAENSVKHHGSIKADIVLVGGGHTHVQVLRSFGMRPEPGVRLTLIAKELNAPYSGMLPGLVAGLYSFDQCHIDLVRLARFASARLINGAANGIDRIAKRVQMPDRAPVAYDLLSIDVGITPSLDGIDGAATHAIAVKPISTFWPKWQALEAQAVRPEGVCRLVIIGGGAAGFELSLAAHHRLIRALRSDGLDTRHLSITLITGEKLLATHNARARVLAHRALRERGIRVIEDRLAQAVTQRSVRLEDGQTLPSDATLISTGAAPPAWFAGTDLPRDRDGYLAVRSTLQVTDDDAVFAVGDCATVLEHPREKSGVFAVRQGPPLIRNLRRVAAGERAKPFAPQRSFLTLLSLANGRAIAAKGPIAGSGRWAWWWKDWIDRRFMDKFNTLPDMPGAGTGKSQHDEDSSG